MATPVTAKNVLHHSASHPLALMAYMIQQYGVEWVDWEPETLEFLLRETPGGVSTAAFDKIMALRTMSTNQYFWQQWHVHLWCTLALTGVPPDFDTLQAPTIMQTYVACDIAHQLREDAKYSDEVLAFIGVVHRHDEVLVPQSPLEAVEVRLDGEPPVDLAEVKKRWPSVRAGKDTPGQDTPADEQLRRMLEIAVALDAVRSECARQLKEVRS